MSVAKTHFRTIRRFLGWLVIAVSLCSAVGAGVGWLRGRFVHDVLHIDFWRIDPVPGTDDIHMRSYSLMLGICGADGGDIGAHLQHIDRVRKPYGGELRGLKILADHQPASEPDDFHHLLATQGIFKMLGFVFSFGTVSRTSLALNTQTLLLCVPDWAIALTGATTAALFWRHNKRAAPRAGLCAECGYDLRASKDRCPECGTPIPPGKDLKPPQTDPPAEPLQ